MCLCATIIQFYLETNVDDHIHEYKLKVFARTVRIRNKWEIFLLKNSNFCRKIFKPQTLVKNQIFARCILILHLSPDKNMAL